MYPMNRPEVMVPSANEKIDENGKVKDERTRKKIRELLQSLVAWTKRMKCGDEESARMTKLPA
jgi:chromate reductase